MIQEVFLFFRDDETSLILFKRGMIISVTSNILPKLVTKMCGHNSSEGNKIRDSLQKINKLLFLESNPIPVKYALNLMGLIDIGIRMPLTWLDEKFHSEIQNELKLLNLI